MRPVAARLISGMVAVASFAASRQSASTPQATFRTGVDVIELDVSVLGKDRQPVQGLTATDFTVLVDGERRPIVAFHAVDVPKPIPPSAPWIRDVAPDVATNTHSNGRVIVIVIDDAGFGQLDEDLDGRAVQKTREVARAVVTELGVGDLAAVVYTENNHSAQNFTADRTRLIAAIDNSAIFPASRTPIKPLEGVKNDLSAIANDPLGYERPSCQPCGVCSVAALDRVSEALRSLPQQRKVIVYISPGIVVYPGMLGPDPRNCNQVRHAAMTDVFRQAALSNVTIQAVDPKGLVTGQVGGELAKNPSVLRLEYLRTMAETTGGRAVVNDNEMERQVPAVLTESSAYYLLGVEAPAVKDDGRFRPIQVHVNYPGVEVRARKGYYAPTTKERKAKSEGPSRDLEASIGGALPKSDFPVEVAVAPFAGSNRKAELAVVAAVAQPTTVAPPGRKRPEIVDVVLSAFNPENGTQLGSWRQRLNIVWNETTSETGLYEVLSRVPVTAGRYELRLGVKIGDGRTASVYAYSEVPDFAREPLALSGLVVSATPSPRNPSKETFANLMPLPPTARRTFRRQDRVGAFVRLYQGGSQALAPATITTRIIDASNKQVGDGFRTVEAGSFGKARSYDYRFDLPVQDLSPGAYLVTVDVASDRHKVQRTVRFRVQ